MGKEGYVSEGEKGGLLGECVCIECIYFLLLFFLISVYVVFIFLVIINFKIKLKYWEVSNIF